MAKSIHPKVFISYAWEEDTNKWVYELAKKLRSDGIDVLLDQWHVYPGDSLTDFMEASVRESIFTLVICTPLYKEKSESGNPSGVKYEKGVITGELFLKQNQRKFIPVLRKGAWINAAPSWVLDKTYIYLMGDPYSENNYQDLLKTLYGKREQAPPLGNPPAFLGIDIDTEKAEREAAKKAAREKVEKEAAEKAAQEKAAAQKAAKEKAEKEAAKKVAKEKAEKEAAKKAAKEKTAKEAAEKAAKEKAEKEAAKKAAKEKAERETAEKAAKEKAEKEAAEKAAKEKAEKEAAEKAAKEKAEKEAAEKAAKEKAEKEAAEKAARERAEKEAAEKAAKEKAEREAAEKAAKEKVEKKASKQATRENADDEVVDNAAKEKKKKSMSQSIFWGIGFLAIISVIALSSLNNNGTPLSPVPTITRKVQQVSSSEAPVLVEETSTAIHTLTPTISSTKTLTPSPTSLPKEIADIDPAGNEILMRLVLEGEFTMGSDYGYDDEKPAHEVYLDSFYMDQYEVTNALYQACVKEGHCTEPSLKTSLNIVDYYSNPEFQDYPVVYVNWTQSEKYCEWRGGYLPTEAQWEKAARGTDQRIYPWGKDLDPNKANYSGSVTAPAKVYSYDDGISPYGIYNMAGNVWEWVSDWYSGTYYGTSPTKNPAGPGYNTVKVIRGGSWYGTGSEGIKSTNRDKREIDASFFYLGFRCAKDAP